MEAGPAWPVYSLEPRAWLMMASVSRVKASRSASWRREVEMKTRPIWAWQWSQWRVWKEQPAKSEDGEERTSAEREMREAAERVSVFVPASAVTKARESPTMVRQPLHWKTTGPLTSAEELIQGIRERARYSVASRRKRA